MQNINFVELFARANSAYVARGGNNLNPKTGLNPDIEKGMRYAQSLTAPQLETLAKLGCDWGQVANGIATATNIKKAMRAPLLLKFIVTGDGAALQGSAQTALLGFCALMIGAKNRNGLNFTVTGKGDENTSDSVSLQRARAVQQAFGKVGASTAPTQLSVAFSVGGLLPMLGLCAPMPKGAPLPEIADSKLAKALVMLISQASDSKIELWAAQSASKGK